MGAGVFFGASFGDSLGFSYAGLKVSFLTSSLGLGVAASALTGSGTDFLVSVFVSAGFFTSSNDGSGFAVLAAAPLALVGDLSSGKSGKEMSSASGV